MKLYFAPGACSLAVHITLRELARAFEPVQVDLTNKTLADGSDYLALSPRGYVPLLELDDGTRHGEVAALLQYLADQEQTQSLIGAVDSSRRLAVTEWLTFVATELHKAFSPWLWNKETAESTRVFVLEKLELRFKELDAVLRRQDYLAGDYSVADAYAFTILNWVNFLSIPMIAYPNVQGYLARVSARPAVQQALRAEGLLK